MIQAKKIVEAIESAQQIVITSHRSPDGDSMGSSLGMYRFIEQLGKKATICHPDACPDFLNWVKDGADIVEFDSNQDLVASLLNDADLIFCLDYNEPGRMGDGMGMLLTNAKGKKVMIDHHLFPSDFADISVSEPTVCSTSQLVYELIDSSGRLSLLNSAIGTPLYLGIMTDTGSFRFSSVTPRTHIILASLLEAGVNHTMVHEQTFDDNRIDKMKLRAHIIAERLEIIKEHRVAIISVTEEEMERFNYVKGDTEGLVNTALSLEGVDVAVFFAEKGHKEGTKISFRSKGDVSVNEIAREHFLGGGHKNAAGGFSEDGVIETIERFKSILPKYF